MLITCPSCASAYDLPAERIGGTGRKVRCAACRESWFVASAEDKPTSDGRPALESEAEGADFEIVTRPVPLPTATVELEEAQPRTAALGRPKAGPRRGASRKPRTRSEWPRRFAQIAATGAIFLAPPLLVADRHRVVAAMPGTASLYRAMGLPVNLIGLSFADVRSTLLQENDTPVLEIGGEIRNDGRSAREVPSLQITIESSRGEALYSWSAKSVEGELPAGGKAPFRVRLTAPPTEARQVVVTFREDRGRRFASWR